MTQNLAEEQLQGQLSQQPSTIGSLHNNGNTRALLNSKRRSNVTDIQVLPSNQTQSQSIIIKNQKGVMARKNYHGPAQVGQGLGVEFNSANPMNKTISNGFNQPQL